MSGTTPFVGSYSAGAAAGADVLSADVFTDVFTGVFTDVFTDVFPDVVTAAFTGAFADVFTGVFADVFTDVFPDVVHNPLRTQSGSTICHACLGNTTLCTSNLDETSNPNQQLLAQSGSYNPRGIVTQARKP